MSPDDPQLIDQIRKCFACDNQEAIRVIKYRNQIESFAWLKGLYEDNNTSSDSQGASSSYNSQHEYDSLSPKSQERVKLNKKKQKQLNKILQHFEKNVDQQSSSGSASAEGSGSDEKIASNNIRSINKGFSKKRKLKDFLSGQ